MKAWLSKAAFGLSGILVPIYASGALPPKYAQWIGLALALTSSFLPRVQSSTTDVKVADAVSKDPQLKAEVIAKHGL